MALLRSTLSKRLIVGLLLCVTVATSSYVGIRLTRAEYASFENIAEGARLGLAQALAASLERSAEASHAVLVMLATELGSSEGLGHAGHSELEAKLRGALRSGRFAAIDLRSPAGDVLISVSDESVDATPSKQKQASLRLHQRIQDRDGSVIGEVVATGPVDSRVESLMHPSVLGTVSLTSLDGRMLADAEGSATDAVFDVSQDDASQGMPVEAGVTSSAPTRGQPIAFATVRGLPVMITVTGTRAVGQSYRSTLIVADGLLLALSWLGIMYCMRRTS